MTRSSCVDRFRDKTVAPEVFGGGASQAGSDKGAIEIEQKICGEWVDDYRTYLIKNPSSKALELIVD
ncbi:MAG: hypothetical protein IH977_14440 [Nitrospinae bacterium]|nr:hypothetical protein [Nitrospinota bacterium]